jgi:hydroxymethylglutaryl-CoA reductase (NADPH)
MQLFRSTLPKLPKRVVSSFHTTTHLCGDSDKPADVMSTSTKAPESQSKSKLLHSFKDMTDNEVVDLVKDGTVSQYKLERELKKAVLAGLEPDCKRAVRVRRLWLESQIKTPASHITDEERRERNVGPLFTGESESARGLPYADFDFNNFYQQTLGTNCENVIGYVPIPVGFVGPLLVSGKEHYVPLATTEGALVASTNRGCRAITESGGATSTVLKDGMTRAPVFRLPTAERAASIAQWVENDDNLIKLQQQFSSTTRFGKLQSVKASVAGRNLFLRFRCQTGDAMGMNMISKGVMECVNYLEQLFPELEMLAVSGNVCTDKKPSAMNWIEGRGKSVVCEATLSGQVIVDVLKCTVSWRDVLFCGFCIICCSHY